MFIQLRVDEIVGGRDNSLGTKCGSNICWYKKGYDFPEGKKTKSVRFPDHITGNLPACLQIYGLFIKNQTACFEKAGFYFMVSYYMTKHGAS